jgi:hypothetical protein
VTLSGAEDRKTGKRAAGMIGKRRRYEDRDDEKGRERERV